MNLNELLAELSEQGVNLWVDGDQLRIRAPKGVMTPELRDELAEHKPTFRTLNCHMSSNYPEAIATSGET